MNDKPIVELRALDYRWVEHSGSDGRIEAEAKRAWRIQFRREGDTEWTTLPVVVINGPPPEET
jgi:hypothetical protein